MDTITPKSLSSKLRHWKFAAFPRKEIQFTEYEKCACTSVFVDNLEVITMGC